MCLRALGVLKVKHEKPHGGKTPKRRICCHVFRHFETSTTSGLWASSLFMVLYFMQFRNSEYPGATNLILIGDLHHRKTEPTCLYFNPEMSCSACCAQMLPVQTTNLDNLLPLTTICDNIWLHREWHAPCELPRTSSSSHLMHWGMESC
jgi:hypothetical protein